MNNELEVLGIAITQFDNRKVLHQEIIEHAESTYGELMFQTRIRGNVALAEAQSMGKHIYDYDPNCNGAEDYKMLGKEVMNRTAELVGQ